MFLWREIGVISINSVTLMVNQMILTATFSYLIKTSDIISVHKKESRQLVNNYRPISTLNTLNEIFETAIFNTKLKVLYRSMIFFEIINFDFILTFKSMI